MNINTQQTKLSIQFSTDLLLYSIGQQKLEIDMNI